MLEYRDNLSDRPVVPIGVNLVMAVGNWLIRRRRSLHSCTLFNFGGLFVVLGVIGFLREAPRKHAMHAAATVGSLGTLAGLGRGLVKLGALFGDDPFHRSEESSRGG